MSNFHLEFADNYSQPAVAKRFSILPYADETPKHHHKKAQLILPLTGSVRSQIENTIWMVPPNCAVWIPSDLEHQNKIAANTDVCMLFVDADSVDMPEQVTILSVNPLVREMILHLANLEPDYLPQSPTARFVEVLFEQLTQLPKEPFDFSIPEESRLRELALALLGAPDNKVTLKEWASRLSMTERTLARLIKRHTNQTFGQWRGQLLMVLALEKLAQNRPVQHISEELGYESVSAFITFFRKLSGKTPNQYRREWR